eukprot:scaffold52700_cov31-Tisochrysis_lutea.AAC.1
MTGSSDNLDIEAQGMHPLKPNELPEFLKKQRADLHRDFELELERVQPHPILYSPSAAITFKDVSFSVKLKDEQRREWVEKTILAPCSGHIPPGKLVAIMGPSGCGKSTLLGAQLQQAPHFPVTLGTPNASPLLAYNHFFRQVLAKSKR